MPKIGRGAAAAKTSKPAAKSGGSFDASFVFKKETKGAVAFEEVDENGKVLDMADASIGSIYLRKSALGGAVPKTIQISVSY